MASVTSSAGYTGVTADDLNATSASSSKSTSSTSSTNGLGQDQFMKLLVAQMQNQNPLDPQNASDLATQLAQFSSLDGITQLNQSFSSMLLLQGINQGTNLIGKSVSYSSGTDGTSTSTGVVQSVDVVSGVVNLKIGGSDVPITKLTSVAGTSTTNTN